LWIPAYAGMTEGKGRNDRIDYMDVAKERVLGGKLEVSGLVDAGDARNDQGAGT